jgi:hypothetical protein
MLRTLLIAPLIYCTTLAALAQQTTTPPSPVRPANKTPSVWPEARWSLPNPNKVNVVTLTRPGVRQKCKVIDLTEDTLTCASSHHRAPTAYKSEDIAALIDPPNHADRNAQLAIAAVDAVFLAASFFVPLAPSIILRVVTGILFEGLAWVDEDDRNNESLLYQRPNTPLTIKLRTH